MTKVTDILCEKNEASFPIQDYGVRSIKKYLMQTANQVRIVATKFASCPEQYKHELAKNIVKKAKLLNVNIKNAEILKYAGVSETTANKKMAVDDSKKAPIVNPHIEKWKHLNLSVYPSHDIPEASVKEDVSGDIHSHAILKWKHPVSGKSMMAYTDEFVKKQADIKWGRVAKITQTDLDEIETNAKKLLTSPSDSSKEAGMIISIICKTGLRPGSRANYKVTGNRGISTLSPQDVSINGDEISLSFTGKSYHENFTTFKDAELATLLKKRIEERRGQEFLFDVDEKTLNKKFASFSDKKLKVKDLRTATACIMGRQILDDDALPPPPVIDDLKKAKKQIQLKLKFVFDKISKKLNNSPAMVKSSYLAPQIIDKWLGELGLKMVHGNIEPAVNEKQEIAMNPKEQKKLDKEKVKEDQIKNGLDHNEFGLNDTDMDMCDVWPTHPIFEPDSVLVRIPKKKS